MLQGADVSWPVEEASEGACRQELFGVPGPVTPGIRSGNTERVQATAESNFVSQPQEKSFLLETKLWHVQSMPSLEGFVRGHTHQTRLA